MGLSIRNEALNVDRVQLMLLEVGGDTPPGRGAGRQVGPVPGDPKLVVQREDV